MQNPLNECLLKSLYLAIAAVESSREAEMWLTDICTPAELEAMADRWGVVEPIMQNMPYRQIHQKTGVSVTTVGRVARCIRYGSGGYKLIYDKLRGESTNEER